jgi:hypothetical protein
MIPPSGFEAILVALPLQLGISHKSENTTLDPLLSGLCNLFSFYSCFLAS